MKIVHFLPALTKGGAEKVAVDLANRAAHDGHEVAIVVAYPVTSGLHSIDPAVTVRHVSSKPSRFAKFAALGPWLIRNRRWLLSRDVVHCHLTFGAVAGSAITLMRRLGGQRRPVVVETYHAVGMPIPAANRALAAMLAGRRDGFVLMAEDSYWENFRQRHPKLPVRIIPNGVALPAHLPSAREVADYKADIGIPSTAKVVGTVGRITEARMPLRMIEVFSEIARSSSDVHFIMGGEGELLNEARKHAHALGIGDRVHFPGLVERPFLAFGIVALYVSINVGPITGIAGLEAAGSGKPVIALQALRDYNRGFDDWIWSDPEPAKVAAEAVHLLSDPVAADRLAKAQAGNVRTNLSDSAMSSAYGAFYADCLAR